jgi:peptidoglycan/LPS O-acetylase OafA/YrhL
MTSARSLILFSVVALLGYVACNVASAPLLHQFYGLNCTTDYFTLRCAYPVGSTSNWMTYPVVFISLLLTMAASHVLLRHTILHPFLMSASVLGLFAVCFDCYMQSPIINEAQIINDTMNILSFVIFASFLLSFVILRHSTVPAMAVVKAISISYVSKLVALVVFAGLKPGLTGALELFILYFIYAFGAFSVHLMTLSTLLLTANANRAPVPEHRSTHTAQALASNAVDGLRGVAILLVVVYHYVPSRFFSFSLGKPLNAILFTIAGFFFASVLHKNSTMLNGAFGSRASALIATLKARHLRLWPVVATVVGLYALLGAIDGGTLTTQIWRTWPYYLSYLGNIPKWMFEDRAFPGHFWMVSAQEQIIVVASLVCLLFGLRGLRKALWFVLLAGIGLRAISILLFMPAHPSWALENPFVVLDSVALGMLSRFAIEEQVTRTSLRRRMLVALVSAVALWSCLPNWNVTYFTLVPLATALLASFLMVTLTDDVRGARAYQAFFGFPLFGMLGRMSLSAFLLHPFVNTVIRLVFTGYSGEEMSWWVLALVGPPLSFGAAYISWRFLEVPLRRLRDTAFSRPILTQPERDAGDLVFSADGAPAL